MRSTRPSHAIVIEHALRGLLIPLDAWLTVTGTVAGTAAFLGSPGLGLILCFGCGWAWYTSLLTAFLAFCGIVAVGMYTEHRLGLGALQRFDILFPPHSLSRVLAICILAEVKGPTLARKKLLEYLGEVTAESANIRRPSRPSPEQALEMRVAQMWLDVLQQAAFNPHTPTPVPVSPSPPAAPPPPAPPAPAPPPAQEPAPGAKKAGGYYDYIPLELPPSAGTDDKK